MKLSDRISNNGAITTTQQRSLGAPKRPVKDALAEGFRQLKLDVHNRLFETLDVAKLENLDPSVASGKIGAAINDLLDAEGRLLTDHDRSRLVEEIKNELLGLGP